VKVTGEPLALQIKSVICTSLGIDGSIPRWLCLRGLDGLGKIRVIELLCPVCRELQKDASPLDLSQVNLLRLPEITKVTLEHCRIKFGQHGGVTDYWVGQCATCRVVFWTIVPVTPTSWLTIPTTDPPG
jgi:hypothetical protein